MVMNINKVRGKKMNISLFQKEQNAQGQAN